MFAIHYNNVEIGQAMPDQLTWTHHVVLLSIEKNDLSKKQSYAAKVIENGWSYRELKEQIRICFIYFEIFPEIIF